MSIIVHFWCFLDCAEPVLIIVAPSPVEEPASPHAVLAMACVATGMPHPHITWQQNGHPIQETTQYHFQEQMQIHGGMEMVVAKLVICPLRGRGGVYTCQAQNQYSSAEASFTMATLPSEH